MKLFSLFTDAASIGKPVTIDYEKAVPLWRRPGAYLALVIILSMLIGLRIAPQFGQSVDEPPRIQYAYVSLLAYSGRIENLQNLQDEKGAFFGMAAFIGAKAFEHLIPGWNFIDRWHYMTFLAFLMGIFFFYRLCQRLIRPGPALAAALLFASQPLLLGHAFVNPKDIPFMAFFLASVSLGLEMVDFYLHQPAAPEDGVSLRPRLATLPVQTAAIWKSFSRRKRRFWIGLPAALAVLGLSFIPIHQGLAWLVDLAYHADPSSGLGQVFQRIATHNEQVSVAAYVTKALTLHSWISLGLAIGLGLSLIWLWAASFPAAARRLLRFLIQPRVLVAGLFLGFASDIRTLGIASGLLVIVYFLVKAGRKAVPMVLEYLGVGAVISYICWPYLWGNPVQNFLASFSQAADFPWIGDNLFAGQLYPNPILPAGYFPTLFAIQFTETALALFLVGLILAAIFMWKKKGLRLDLLLLGAWFGAPIAAALLLHSTVYNNFRQFLFVVPPLFVIAGFAWQALWDRLKHRVILFALFVGLALLPSLYWDVHLYPYQYIYYNSLAGGVSGAFNVYENDYWLTSDKEAMEYVNRVAPPNAPVYFWSINITAAPYARPDLVLYPYNEEVRSWDVEAGYAIEMWTRANNQLIFPNSPILYQVSRDGNIFAVVKKVTPGDPVLAP